MAITYKYDVFLSCCHGTRGTFTGNLYHALRQKRIKTAFLSHKDCLREQSVESSEDRWKKLIQESRLSIVVFSKDYASSIYYLDGLVNIIDRMKNNNHLVWPIFYKLDQEELQNSRFRASLESESERMPLWKEALSQFSRLYGWNYRKNEYEYELIQKIVKEVVESLPRYDIFLSFCGEDTRHSFTGFLYRALCREGFKTFMDDEGLEGGNDISKTLLEAIEKSKLSIVVFSENYGYSSWCLDEFVKIVECKETKNQLVWPIFYKIEESDVSNQTNSYGDAMAGHEDKYGMDPEKVKNWRSALSKVASLRGDYYHIKKNEYESEVIKKIVESAIGAENQL